MSSSMFSRCSVGRSVRKFYRRFHATPVVSTSHHRAQLNADEIIIPTRVERGPTDLLKAIASTVKKDYHSPHYKYIDDPETIPMSSVSKKAYSLAKASGKRAAQYVIKKYPRYFEDQPCEPAVEAFLPPLSPVLDENTAEGLQERIDLRLVEDAYSSYNKCLESDVKLSDKIVCDLLDLMCVYNSKNAPDSLLPEEQDLNRLMTQDNSRERIRNTWRDDGPAELVFASVENPSAHAYCSLIRGMAKYFQVDKAVSLFKEMKSKGLKPDLQSYNAILGLSSFVHNHIDERLQYVKELFASMKQEDVQPSLDTFNKALSMVARSSRFNPILSAQFASSLLNEMTACDIEPSLATWYHVIRVFYYNDDVTSGILEEILDRIEGTRLSTNHPDDLEFFSIAMVKCAVNLNDLELATRIDNLLNCGQNYKLIGDIFKEGVYYNFYLKTLCMFEQIDTIMEQFERIVPHSFSPTFNALNDLFEALDLNEGYEYLPKVWSDLYSLGYDRSSDVTEKIASLMAKRKLSKPLQRQLFQLLALHFEAALGEIDILKEKDNFDQNTVLPIVSAPLLSHMIQVSLNADEPIQADKVFGFYVEHKAMVKGSFVEKTAVNLVDKYVRDRDLKNAMEVLKVMTSFAHASLDATADKIKEELDLSDAEKALVDDVF